MNNTDIKPTFWWVNPWATARALSTQVSHLTGRLADEILANVDLRDRLERELEKNTELEEAGNPKRRGRVYATPVSDLVYSAVAEGLTVKEACKKYKLNEASVRALACRHKIAFAWSGKGRKPKNAQLSNDA